MHGADRAQEEVEAYEAQISKLKQELDNAIKMCKFNLRFESEMERTQGATREFARVRASLNLEAASVKDNVLELGPAETTLEYLEYTWTDKAAPKCTHTGRGSGGRFRVTSAQLMLKPAEAPPKLTLENVSLVADPGKTNEVHTVSCEGLTMSFPGTYWSAAFGHLHGGSTGFNASDWTVGSGEQAQARKVFEIMKECNKATCKERTEMVLQRRTQATAITFR
jgi:hypothetical protein